jgi:hypothetical protein
VRALAATWLCGLVLVRTGCAAADPAPADTQFANFAFASELGSGIYEMGGTVMQVYQLPFSYTLRPPSKGTSRPGIKLILPVTIGFFNFQTSDLAHLEIPTAIGALSLEPGVELNYALSDAWSVYPYLKAGRTFASQNQINAAIFGVGLRSDYRFGIFDSRGLYRAALAYAGVHYDGDVPNDSFTRLRNGVELRHSFPWPSPQRGLELGPYAMADIYFNAPSGPASGISARTLQFEAGLMFGASPMWTFRGWPLPRLGVGYREAGILSGWRLVFGDPF